MAYLRSERLAGVIVDAMQTPIPIYLINLDSDSKRLAAVHTQLAGLGLAYERFPAIRGDNLPDWLAPYLGNTALSHGEIGCYASHLTLMQRIAESGRTSLILEDDIEIKKEFPMLMEEILAAKMPWEIIRLSNISRRPQVVFRTLSGGYAIVKYIRVPDCTGGYLIKPEGARRFLQWRTARTRPIDIDLIRVWEHQLTTLGVSPLPITQNIGVSTIEEMGGRDKKANPQTTAGKRYDEIRRFLYNVTSIGFSDTIGALISNSHLVGKRRSQRHSLIRANARKDPSRCETSK